MQAARTLSQGRRVTDPEKLAGTSVYHVSSLLNICSHQFNVSPRRISFPQDTLFMLLHASTPNTEKQGHPEKESYKKTHRLYWHTDYFEL
jgi:hypothetical protein